MRTCNKIFIAIEASERDGHRNKDETSDDDCHHESCSHSHEYIFQCNNNEWVRYMLDEAPAEEGLFYGDYAPGNPGFVGYVSSPFPSPARIQIKNPKGASELLVKIKFAPLLSLTKFFFQ